MSEQTLDRAAATGPINRRRFLLNGSAAGLGLSLPGLLRAKALQAANASGGRLPARIKSCIFVFYYGGPSQLDTYDMKPNGPSEVRGEFQPIATSVPGLQICEHLPRMAQVMHRVAVVRTVTHQMRLHDAACVATLSGRDPQRGDGENFVPPAESTLFPSHGAALSYLRRDNPARVPYAALPFFIQNVVPVPAQTGGFLGSAWNPFQINGDPEKLSFRADTLQLPDSLTLARIAQRSDLLRQFDASRAASGSAAAGSSLRSLYEQAFELLASEEVRTALEIDREDPATRQRYGLKPNLPAFPPGSNELAIASVCQQRGQSLLLARRLVEAGVPFINVYDFRQQGTNWDSHGNCFVKNKQLLLPQADQSLAALIEDLHERGLLDTTLVVAMGEFGRTPKINKDAGRDHWPDCYCCLMAGGGIQGGAVYGTSDKMAAYPDTDPVTPGDLAATIFARFGVDPASEIRDTSGRPYKVSEGTPLARLFVDG
ncbi:MAG: DUF1501 domain-containing protein [Pirellulales bacterium]